MSSTKSTVRQRIEQWAGARERGASALEWALIAAIVVVAATLIGTAVYNVVQDKASTVTECGGVAPGGSCG